MDRQLSCPCSTCRLPSDYTSQTDREGREHTDTSADCIWNLKHMRTNLRRWQLSPILSCLENNENRVREDHPTDFQYYSYGTLRLVGWAMTGFVLSMVGEFECCPNIAEARDSTHEFYQRTNTERDSGKMKSLLRIDVLQLNPLRLIGDVLQPWLTFSSFGWPISSSLATRGYVVINKPWRSPATWQRWHDQAQYW